MTSDQFDSMNHNVKVGASGLPNSITSNEVLIRLLLS